MARRPGDWATRRLGDWVAEHRQTTVLGAFDASIPLDTRVRCSLGSMFTGFDAHWVRCSPSSVIAECDDQVASVPDPHKVTAMRHDGNASIMVSRG